MANIKITDLTAYTDPATTDVVPIVDIGNDTTKKVSVGEVVGKISGDVDVATDGTSSIAAGVIVNADVNAAAAIADTKLDTISTAGKVSNSATTATDANTASAIVARDASGDFSAGTITADLTGNADTATALNSNRTFAVTGDVTGTVSSDLTSGASIATSIASGVIVDADVNASAAIAGTKIDPDFGSQTIETTGVFSAAGGSAGSPSITFTGDTDTGLYSPGANQLALSTNGTGRLFVDASGNTLLGSYDNSGGLGERLSVNGAGIVTQSAAATNRGLFGTFGGSTQIIGAFDSIPLEFRTNNTECLRITSAGLVGIGTSSPSTLLHVSGGSGTTFTLDGASDYSSTAAILMNHGRSEIRTTIAATGGNPGGSLLFRTRNNSGSLVDAVTIDSSQRVGIGVTGPTDKLHLHEASSNANYLHITNDTTGSTAGDGVIVGLDSSEQFYIYSYENNNMIFGTNNAERARIDSSGRLGIGTSAPGAKLDVSGDVIFNGGGTQFPIQFANAFTPNAQRADLLLSANATSNNALRFGTIASSGGVTLQGTRQSDSSQKVNLVLNPDGGSVGIGTTSPDAELDVNGRIYLAEGNELAWHDGAGTQAARIYASATDELRFEIGSAASRALTIDSSGRLLVGTSSGTAKLTVQDARVEVRNTNGASIGNSNTTSVSTTATTIIDDAGFQGRLWVINGAQGNDRFCDLIMASTAANPVVVQSFSAFGTPAARTYTRLTSTVQLAMASGTYDVRCIGLGA